MTTKTAAHRRYSRDALRCAAPIAPVLLLTSCSTDLPSSTADFLGGLAILVVMSIGAGFALRAPRGRR